MKITELQRQKLASRRFWFVTWAATLATFWGTVGVFSPIGHPVLVIALPLLIAIVASYVTIETVKKKPPGEK